jgi:RNA polymerase sigma-70 factor (ECF subfamily)
MTWPPELPFPVVLAHARALDQLAIGRLYRRFLPVVYRFALGRVGDVHADEDVTSETFIAMVEGIAGTRAQDELTFAAWVLGIARNKVALHFRRAQMRVATREIPDDDWHPAAAAEGGDPLDVVAARESWSEVVSALNQLTEDQRTVVLYRCVLGYSTEDVARLMDKQPGTIRALQFRALASLARRLEDSPSREVSVQRERRGNDATRR